MSAAVRIGAAILALGAAFLWAGGVLPALSGDHYSWDLVPLYAASRALILDINPYDDSALKEAWAARAPKGSTLTPPGFYSFPMVYPPGAFVPPLAVAVFGWPDARVIWLVLNIAALLATVGLALRTWGAAWGVEARLLFVAYALLLDASRETIQNGQITPLVVLAITAALAHAERGKPIAAGLWLGASLVKPTLGVGLILSYALRGRVRLVATAVVTAILFNGVVLARIGAREGLRLHGELVELARTEEAILDPASKRVTQDLLSLEPLLHRLAGTEAHGRPETTVVMVVLWLLGGGVVALILRSWILGRDALRSLHLIDAIALVLPLLLFYHRAYDALVLVPVLALLMADAPRLPGIARFSALSFVAVPLALFLGPHTPWSLDLGESAAWLEEIVWVPHRVWGLIALFASLAGVLHASARRENRAVEREIARWAAWGLAAVVAAGLVARGGVAWAARNPPRHAMVLVREPAAGPGDLEAGLLLEQRQGLIPPGPAIWRSVLRRDLGRQALPKIGDAAVTNELKGWLRFPSAGLWRVELAAADGARLWLDGRPVIDARGFHGFGGKQVLLEVRTPGDYPLRIEHHAAFVGNEISLRWAREGADLAPVPLENLFQRATEAP